MALSAAAESGNSRPSTRSGFPRRAVCGRPRKGWCRHWKPNHFLLRVIPVLWRHFLLSARWRRFPRWCFSPAPCFWRVAAGCRQIGGGPSWRGGVFRGGSRRIGTCRRWSILIGRNSKIGTFSLLACKSAGIFYKIDFEFKILINYQKIRQHLGLFQIIVLVMIGLFNDKNTI